MESAVFAPVARSDSDTIFALATGQGPSAIAIFRVSGAHAGDLFSSMSGKSREHRKLSLTKLRHPDSGQVLDSGFAIWFSAPDTYTGEDYFEFHVHGGTAVVNAFLSAFAARSGVRLADPGEFSRRALLNGKMDLGSLEGLADLISAQTEAQRQQSIAHASGYLRHHVERWRSNIIGLLAEAEAIVDFPDESDTPSGFGEGYFEKLRALKSELVGALEDGARGEMIRDGFKVAIVGPANVGKSSLLNAIAKRQAAIVSEIPGTTRDVIEVVLDLRELQVRFFDTAGFREATDAVEVEGIRRAVQAAESADLVLVLRTTGLESVPVHLAKRSITVWTKGDLFPPRGANDVVISAVDNRGISDLLERIGALARRLGRPEEAAIVTRTRHARAIASALQTLDGAFSSQSPEIMAENLRVCLWQMNSLIGRVDVEDVLGEVFSQFCIGK